MRKILQKLLSGFVVRMANKYSSRPQKKRVHDALSKLYNEIQNNPGKRGLKLDFTERDSFIVFSDQHKGARNFADDFGYAANNYQAALNYYNLQQFTFISLGDSEELWENTLDAVKKHNKSSFTIETEFLKRKAFVKIFGNHDLYWDNDPLAAYQLEKIYGEKLKVFEGIILTTTITDQPLSIFLTHGHQGDVASDGNWFSKWFVSRVWAPLQSYLRINPNTPAFSNQLKTVHNQLMYEWAAAQQSVLITGHTHQPVFNSFTHLERIYIKLDAARKANDAVEEEKLLAQLKKEKIMGAEIPSFTADKPNYFNTGCCCFSDEDITGLEITEGKIRLIKWGYRDDKSSRRMVLEETDLANLQHKV
ncbi:MAG: metallophosphoesterase [Bacteroidota bacterium]